MYKNGEKAIRLYGSVYACPHETVVVVVVVVVILFYIDLLLLISSQLYIYICTGEVIKIDE